MQNPQPEWLSRRAQACRRAGRLRALGSAQALSHSLESPPVEAHTLARARPVGKTLSRAHTGGVRLGAGLTADVRAHLRPVRLARRAGNERCAQGGLMLRFACQCCQRSNVFCVC